MLCRTLPSHLPILGTLPPRLTQTLAINPPTTNRPFIRPTSQIRTVSGGILGSTRAHNMSINDLTTYHTSLNSNSCPRNVISNNRYNPVLIQTSSCYPLASPSRKLGSRQLGPNQNPLSRPPRPHNRLHKTQTCRSNRHRLKTLARNPSVGHTIPTLLPRGRNG